MYNVERNIHIHSLDVIRSVCLCNIQFALSTQSQESPRIAIIITELVN